MRLEQIMARPVRCCAPDDALRSASRLMRGHDCGWLPVCSGDGAADVVGVMW